MVRGEVWGVTPPHPVELLVRPICPLYEGIFLCHEKRKSGHIQESIFIYYAYMHVIHIYYPVELLGRSIYRYMEAYNTCIYD